MYTDAMQTVSDIFDALGGPSAVSRALSIGASTASEMKRRGSIPSEYWVQVVEAAKRAARPDVTYELLALVHARARGRIPSDLDGREPSPEPEAA